MARRKRTARRTNPSNALAKAINNLVDAKLNKLLEKQTPRFRKTLTGIEKALARVEKKVGKVSAGRPVRAKKTKARKTRKGRKPTKPKTCSVRGCQRPARARGLCNSHYVSALRKGTIKTQPRKKKKTKGK